MSSPSQPRHGLRLRAATLLSLALSGCRQSSGKFAQAVSTAKPTVHAFLNVLPGQTCAQILPQFDPGASVFGKASEHTLSAVRGTIADIGVYAGFDPNSCKATMIIYTGGATVAMETPDGVILGRDTIATICQRVNVPLSSIPFKASNTPEEQTFDTTVGIDVPPHPGRLYSASYTYAVDGTRVLKLPAHATIHDIANDVVTDYMLTATATN